MKKSIELKQKRTALQKEIMGLLAANKNHEAATKGEELKDLDDAYKAAVAVEISDLADLGTGTPVGAPTKRTNTKHTTGPL